MSVRIALAQIRPEKGNYGANIARLGQVLAQVARLEPKVDLLVAPETVTSGYFVEGGVRDVAVTAGTLLRDLAAVHATAKAPPLDVAVGFYELFEHRLYNACLYASLGGKPKVRHVHRKLFLPTYGVFDEERFVERGHDGVRAFDTGWPGGGGRAAVLICEDAWHSITGTLAALDGAQLIIVPSAPPARGAAVAADGLSLPGSVIRWERILRTMAEEHGVYVAFAPLVGFEGGKGFPGGATLVGPSGDVLVRGPLFEEAVVTGDIEPAEITRARTETPLLADLENQLPDLVKQLGSGEWGVVRSKRKRAPVEFDPAPNGTTPHSPLPSAPVHVVGRGVEAGNPLSIDVDLARRWLVSFLKDEVVLRRKFKQGIVGLSGGVDSALTAFLAAEALGADNVIGLRMPYRTSSPESLEHAQLVIDKLGIRAVTVDITAPVDAYFAQIQDDDPRRRGNVMARQRMIALFDLSQKHRALPLGTGNKSERLLGYFTWHADDSPPVNPLGDLFKTQVWALARHVGVPEVIVAKPATADLVRGQTDEGDLGIPYPRADRILYYLLRGLDPAAIVERGFTEQEIALVRGRLESTHWKRRLPTVAMMSQTAIGEFYLRPVDY